MKLVFIYGGKSEEHDISLLSSFSVLKEIDYNRYQVQLVFIARDGKWIMGPTLSEAPQEKSQLNLSYEGHQTDGWQGKVIMPSDIYDSNAVIFPLLHGPNGEDGTIQGFFEMMNMPYVGAGVLASACGMDKIMTKYILSQAGIPQLPFVPISTLDWTEQEEVLGQCEATMNYPMFIKPANLGSSVGISKAENRSELKEGIEEAFRYDRRVVVEQGVQAREIEVAVLGNDNPQTTLPGEIVKTVDFYDFDAKYVNNDVKLQIPADLPEDIQKSARQYAKQAYMVLDCSGLTRCDLFLTSDDKLYVNEVNTMPGFTPFSMYPLLWENMGLSYGDLIEKLIQLAIERHEAKQKLI